MTKNQLNKFRTQSEKRRSLGITELKEGDNPVHTILGIKKRGAKNFQNKFREINWKPTWDKKNRAMEQGKEAIQYGI